MATFILVVRVLIGAAPALILVSGAVLLMIVALALGASRRTYALDAADKFTALAGVIMGMPVAPATPP
jgi:hypothetical protein